MKWFNVTVNVKHIKSIICLSFSMTKYMSISSHVLHFIGQWRKFFEFQKKVSCSENITTSFAQNYFYWTFNILFRIKLGFWWYQISLCYNLFYAKLYSRVFLLGYKERRWNKARKNIKIFLKKKKIKGEKRSKKDIKIFLRNKSRSYLSIWKVII